MSELGWPLTPVWCWEMEMHLRPFTIQVSAVCCALAAHNRLCTTVFMVPDSTKGFLSFLSIGHWRSSTTDDLDEQFGHKICISIFDICR